MTTSNSHDRLQSDCFLWAQQNFPQCRKLLFAVQNEIDFIPCESKSSRISRAVRAKSIGVTRGVFDILLYWHGILYGFDFKVGKDRLSDDQHKFKERVELHGGKCYEIRSVLEFQTIFTSIMQRTNG